MDLFNTAKAQGITNQGQSSPLWIQPNPEKIPSELKSLNQWVVWAAVDRHGKITKPPFNATSPFRDAKVNDPATWSSFETAYKRYQHGKNLTGIGFMLSEKDPFCGWDLDHCIDPVTGLIDESAMNILETMDSYAEISPSGTGLRIFFKGTIPPGRRKQGNIEIYQAGRYLTVTGNHIGGTPTTINDRTEKAAQLHAKVFGKEASTKTEPIKNRVSTGGERGCIAPLDDMALLERSFTWKNGQRYQALWRGDFSGYPSQSEADQAFCNRLAWLLGKDAKRVDSIFRQSGLMRKKWDKRHHSNGSTYGQKTIEAAINGASSTYQPRKRNEGNKASNKRASAKKDIYQQIVEEYNQKHAIIMLGGKLRVMNYTIDPISNLPDISFSTCSDFTKFYAYDKTKITVKNDKGEEKEKTLKRAMAWLEDSRATRYKGLVFDPSKKEIPGYYNLWRGFAVEPKQGDWSLFREHIEQNIAAGNPKISKYILAWLARIVQDPGGKRPGTSIVMRGKQGTGKGVFAEQFGKLLGNHFVPLSQAGQVTGRFNLHLKSAVFVFVDEGFWGGDRKSEGVIKSMITEDRLAIEGKGQDIIQIKNNINMLIASNNEWIVPAGLEERRFFVIDVADNKKQDSIFFGAIEKQMDNGGREAMLYDLQRLDISDVNLRKFERTEALFDQILSSMTTVQKYWFERLNDGTTSLQHGEWEGKVSSKAQHNEYVDFANSIGDRYPKCSRQFGLELNKLCKKIYLKKGRLPGGLREQVRYFPSLEECRAEFEDMVNMKIQWDSIT